MGLSDAAKQPRQGRAGRYKVWLLQKRLAELSAQVEASVLEARQLILWKQSHQPLTVADLTDEDRRILDHNHRVRLAEVVQKHCTGALKSITQHKWAFPFNNPVDTTRFPDYPKVIAHPMDFSTIRTRQDSGFYRDPKDWWADIMLVFSNAKRYNAPGTDCYLMAQTLQEVSEEKYEKLIAPRLAEEAASALRDEMYLKKKRAEQANQQISEAMDAQCAVLFSLMAELHAAIREAKLLSASLCEPLTLAEKQALAATIQGLPTAQLESIVSFVASRHPPSVSQSEVQPGASGAPSRKVQLNLGRYDPLMLRQLQHLVGTCTASRHAPQMQQQPAGAVAAAARMLPPQRPPASAPGAQQTAAAAAPVSGGGPDRSASASPSPALSPAHAALADPAAAAAGAAAALPARTASPALLPAADGATASAGEAAQVPAVQQASEDVAGPQERAAVEPQQQPQLSEQQQASATTAGPVPAPAGALTPSPAPTGAQRNISDVVTNATASGISLRAGIRWPGLAVGAGARPRSRALLSLSFDGNMATAADLVAACPLPQPAPQRPSGRLSGVRRRALARQAAEAGAAKRARPDAAATAAIGRPPQLPNGLPSSGPVVAAVGATRMEADVPAATPSS